MMVVMMVVMMVTMVMIAMVMMMIMVMMRWSDIANTYLMRTHAHQHNELHT